jgi:hypothetical protein
LATSANAQSPSAGGQNIHIFPPPAPGSGLPAVTPPLQYHGGPVMTGTQAYAIFWVPPTLQDGSPASMTSHYQTVLKTLLIDYPSHTLASNNTQYYQISGSKKTYIPGTGSLAASYIDTNPFPASGCTDSVTGSNCITDAQLQAEVQNVMAAKGWTGGLNRIFMVFTPSNEGSCFDSTSTACAYTYYCAYHGYFVNSSGADVIYSNEPYGDPNYCQTPGVPSPNNDVNADTAATAASHELTEAITDPLLNAWFNSAGSEIGDVCAYIYGANGWDAGLANQAWNGHFYEIQEEWDNHANGCVQLGP